MKKNISEKLLFLAFSFILFAGSISAQSAAADSNNGQITLPVLNNHKFVVNQYVRSPFINTYIRNTLGVGQALDLQVPIMEIDGVPVTGLRGDLFFLTVEFEYQYAVNNWLAVFGNFSVVSRIGNGAQAILAQGINATYGLELGWMFKLIKTDKVMLSATANIWNKSGTIINIYDFIQNIIDAGELLPDNHILITRNFIQGGGGFRFAWAASELIGVNALTEFAYGESVDRRDENELFYNLSGSVDFDLNKVTSVPIGFALGFKIDSFTGGTDNTIDGKVTSIFLRTAYTGRDDFLISLDMTWAKLPLRQLDQTLNGGTMTINLEYFF
ncbi:MAG: hypothetical protein GXO87_08910 [Chlorobi bacterium]|nr:hypothetical protein [Chlorobiota bacterium]